MTPAKVLRILAGTKRVLVESIDDDAAECIAAVDAAEACVRAVEAMRDSDRASGSANASVMRVRAGSALDQAYTALGLET